MNGSAGWYGRLLQVGGRVPHRPDHVAGEQTFARKKEERTYNSGQRTFVMVRSGGLGHSGPSVHPDGQPYVVHRGMGRGPQ